MNRYVLYSTFCLLVALTAIASVISVVDTRRKESFWASVTTDVATLRTLAAAKDSQRAAAYADRIDRVITIKLDNYARVSDLVGVSLFVSLVGLAASRNKSKEGRG